MRNFDICDLVEIYNHLPQILLKNTVKVSLTKESLINQSNEIITLTIAPKGNYCVFSTEDDDHWLFPKKNLKNNDFNFGAIKTLFNCNNYHTQDTGLLILIKPAKISLMSSGTDWKLEELGEINFVDLSSSDNSQFQLELANQKIVELESQLEEVYRKHDSENKSQQLQLSELAKKRNLLEYNLKELNEKLQTEKQQAIEERQRLLSLIEGQIIDSISHLKNDLTEIKQALQINQISWLNIYNKNPESFEKSKYIELLITPDSIDNARMGVNQPVILENKRKGNYWIFVEDNTTTKGKYLVPKANFKINEYTLETIKLLFNTNGDNLGNYSKLIVIKPALVISIDQDKWQLVELGIIQLESDNQYSYIGADYNHNHQPSYTPPNNIVTAYNHDPKKVCRNTIEVAETIESIHQRRLGNNQPAILENVSKSKGNYCIIPNQQGSHYLVPKDNFKINGFTYETMMTLFDCYNYQPQFSNNFKLVHPAIIVSLNENSWSLQKKGKLSFEMTNHEIF